MQRKMTNDELSNLQYQSETFKEFLTQYVTGDIWIRSRGEEETSIWGKLVGTELEVAKKIIITELNVTPDPSYIRAVGYFRDERAIPVLKNIAETLSDQYIGEKLIAAKVLYEWIEYDKYIPLLEGACKTKCELTHDYMEISFDSFTDCLEPNVKERLFNILKLNNLN